MKTRNLLLIFFLAILSRSLWSYFSGIQSFSGPDWGRYDALSDAILNGDYNLETSLYIIAPLYPYLVAAVKALYGSGYVAVLQLLQILVSSVSVIFLVKTAEILFNNRSVTLLVGLAYSLYPITFYYVHQFSQESVFQSLFIVSLYYLSVYLKRNERRNLVYFSIVFSLAMLTKSHVILAMPFFVLAIVISGKSLQGVIMNAAIFVVTVLLITMPYGVYNKVVNDTYVIASGGGGSHFLIGHNDDVYRYIVDPPENGSPEYERIKGMDYRIWEELSPKVKGVSYTDKQEVYFKAGLDWMFENPGKTVGLALQNMVNFLMPGFSKKHHPFRLWLIAALMSLPVFVLAYYEIVRRLITDFGEHMVILSLFLTMVGFSVVFYSQNRFRVVTIEPWYLMYACSAAVYLFGRAKERWQRKH